jgi:tetratricopeptide (TPR) repeat protein
LRPRFILLACLAGWALLAPAALRAFDLNLVHLALRGWQPAAGALPGLVRPPLPGCADSPAAPAPGPCGRAAALAWLASSAPAGPAQARLLLDRPATTRPLDLYFLGLAAGRAGDWPAAWRAWARIGAEPPILARGDALMQQGQPAAALQEYSAVLAVLPANAGAYVARGRANAALGRWADALADYRRAVALGGGPVAQTELGTALWYANHDLAGARAALAAGWTGQPTAWAGWSWARDLLDAGDPAGALAAADTALRRFPLDPQLQAVRGEAARAAGRAGP